MPQAASVMKTLFRQHYVGPTMATYKASATARKNKVARIAPEDIVPPNCPLCNREPDSLEHIILRCDAAVLGDITKKMTTAMNTITGDDTRTRQLVFTMKQVLADAHTTDDMYEAACGVLTGHAAAHFESLLRQHYNSDTNITLTVKEVKLLAQILAIKFRHAHTRIKAHRAACTDKLGHHENRIRLGLEKLTNIPQPVVVTRPPRQHARRRQTSRRQITQRLQATQPPLGSHPSQPALKQTALTAFFTMNVPPTQRLSSALVRGKNTPETQTR